MRVSSSHRQMYRKLFDDYIHDMKIIQHYAALNRKAMMDVILVGMRLTAAEQFTTIHNYIDTDNMILRKGAVAAYAGQKLLIPVNMRDGSGISITGSAAVKYCYSSGSSNRIGLETVPRHIPIWGLPAM